MQIHQDFDLSKVLWYQIGGKARYFIQAENREDIERTVDFADKNNVTKLFICGLGSNLIFTDEYFDGLVLQISLKDKGKTIQLSNEGFVECFAGEELDSLIQFAFANNLTGFEWAGGLPGTVGAGIRGNVGAFGGEIKDAFFDTEVMQLYKTSFSFLNYKYHDMHFSYRNSLIKEARNLIIVQAKFFLKHATSEELQKAKEKYEENILYRKTHHPLEYPTCGSVFKNIKEPEHVQKILSVWPDIEEKVERNWYGKVSMGYVIKRLGFSGYKVGGMQVSEKHANFIVNLGEAKAKDVKTIIKTIQEKVFEAFGFIPEIEVEIVE